MKRETHEAQFEIAEPRPEVLLIADPSSLREFDALISVGCAPSDSRDGAG